MKKLGTLVLALALTVMFAVPAMSAHRTLEKSLVKTEISTKVVKAEVVTINQVLPVNVSCLTLSATHFELLEANRPPGFILAYANYAPFTRYTKGDALIKLKYDNRQLPKSCLYNLQVITV